MYDLHSTLIYLVAARLPIISPPPRTYLKGTRGPALGGDLEGVFACSGKVSVTILKLFSIVFGWLESQVLLERSLTFWGTEKTVMHP